MFDNHGEGQLAETLKVLFEVVHECVLRCEDVVESACPLHWLSTRIDSPC
jgi:hypothetical protein